jgi:LCP family protein required for cell wall assembly
LGGEAKINDAAARGGIPLARQTVEQFLAEPIDYTIATKVNGVQDVIDAIGGVRVDVEKDMDYEDKWGHLSIHLKKGEQLLSGEEAVGYMRFRHDAEGDFGRMRRQQQTLRALASQLKTPNTLFRLSELIDVFEEAVETDLSRQQLMALGRMFYDTNLDDVTMASLPALDRTIRGIAYLIPLQRRKELMVRWLLQGDDVAGNALISVRVLNGCGDRGATSQVIDELEAQGFEVQRGPRVPTQPESELVEHKVVSGASWRVARSLKLPVSPTVEPAAWPAVTLVVGRDLAARFPSVGDESSTPGAEGSPAGRRPRGDLAEGGTSQASPSREPAASR